jgi:hypothetical protein
VRETERSAQRELLSILRLVDAGTVAVSDTTRRASSATIAAITAVLEGGDYYPFVPPTDRWHDENAGPMRAFAWPLLILRGYWEVPPDQELAETMESSRSPRMFQPSGP